MSDDLVARLRRYENEAEHAAADRIEALERWKADAMETLAGWERVWVSAGCPGPLGAVKSDNVRRFMHDMIDDEPTAEQASCARSWRVDI